MTSRSASDGDGSEKVTWIDRIESLRRPSAWPPGEGPIEKVQTHVSIILLGRNLVAKLKMPLDLGFLYYTTVEKRRRACEAEVALNRRLCPDTYLGVRPIVEVAGESWIDFDGAATGRIVDYAVLMNRLPARAMLDRMVDDGTVSESAIDRVASRLAAFHESARRGPDVDRFGSQEVIWRNWDENFTQAVPYIGRPLSAETFALVRDWITRWMADHQGLLRQRVRDGRICDGHGDVRCDSVCITGEAADDICIYDCIEFSERFRCGDTAAEVAFLAMDLDARGRGDLGYLCAERYAGYAADPGLFALLPFYRCYRAFVRGKVMSFCLDGAEFSSAEQDAAAASARRFFDRARRYAAPLQEPTVIVVSGLSGTGKTSIARAIAGELGLRVVSSDVVRRRVFAGEEEPVSYGSGRYSAEATRLTYEAMLERGRALLEEGGGVVLDATFRRAADRERAQEMATAAGARFRLIECRLPAELVRERLMRRAGQGYGNSEATWDTYLRQLREYEPVAPPAAGTCLVLDNDAPLDENSRRAADWLRTGKTRTLGPRRR
jgi:aminoglycoside phosphotransferase family enzyme/predicted kinase